MENKLIGEEVSLQDMLNCRERRVYIQNEFIKKYKTSLISFCMNIPGPVKTNEEIRKVFNIGIDEILKTLKENNLNVIDFSKIYDKTGDEYIAVVDTKNLNLLKNVMIEIEENHEMGRFFDIDVLNSKGEKISREKYRKCFICNRQAQECASKRIHSVEEMQEFIAKKIKEYLFLYC